MLKEKNLSTNYGWVRKTIRVLVISTEFWGKQNVKTLLQISSGERRTAFFCTIYKWGQIVEGRDEICYSDYITKLSYWTDFYFSTIHLAFLSQSKSKSIIDWDNTFTRDVVVNTVEDTPSIFGRWSALVRMNPYRSHNTHLRFLTVRSPSSAGTSPFNSVSLYNATQLLPILCTCGNIIPKKC